jgi:hypothetical protein
MGQQAGQQEFQGNLGSGGDMQQPPLQVMRERIQRMMDQRRGGFGMQRPPMGMGGFGMQRPPMGGGGFGMQRPELKYGNGETMGARKEAILQSQPPYRKFAQ